MLAYLWLIPALPLFGFVTLITGYKFFNQRIVSLIGIGSIAASAIVAFLVALEFGKASELQAYTQVLWNWISITEEPIRIGLYLDSLSLLMVLVVSFIAFLIHLYSSEFVADDASFARFFAYMNLFVAMMLLLVLADNFLLLYLGWEGVGLCSYLLIGFWYQDAKNGQAARKAFIITRIGDTAMLIGILLIFSELGTFNIQDVLGMAKSRWLIDSTMIISVTLLLLGGAVGKSAQLPLQTWLPDAMAGPTPVSALIHAATMVTAGVYLLARTQELFALAPSVQLIVAIIGTVTLLMASFSALTQTDIKRILAYSTMSQVGYMFLALGVGAWSAAMFHFMTHAFFKALLFLAAGAVILNLHHEHNIFKMGGLRKSMPVTFWTFIIGAAALAALPLVSAGFYSKDLILLNAWAFPEAGEVFWLAGTVGALLTSLYIFRLVFVVFFGEAKTPTVNGDPGLRMLIPLLILAVPSIVGGFIPLPWADLHDEVTSNSLVLQTITSMVSVIGIVIAYLIYKHQMILSKSMFRWPGASFFYDLWQQGWRFDVLYDWFFTQPFIRIAHQGRNDFIDKFYWAVIQVNVAFHNTLSRTQSGHVRLYAAGVACGTVILLGISIIL